MGTIDQQLGKIPREYYGRILSVIEQIRSRDFSGLDRKKLKGYDSIFRIRIGNYRIVYYDDGTCIIIKSIGRRNERTYEGA